MDEVDAGVHVGVGLPLEAEVEARRRPAAQAARDWTLALSDATGLPAAMWDERLSTSAVNRFLVSEMDMSRKKRAAVVDGMAAAYVLQSALDASRPAVPDAGRHPSAQ